MKIVNKKKTKKKGEPHRFRAFVNDLLTFNYEFIKTEPLSHVFSQIGILTVSNSDIHFIGKIENMMEHWEELTKFCKKIKIDGHPTDAVNAGQGHKRGYGGMDETYLRMMGLNTKEAMESKISMALKAIDYQTFNKIIEYYWQDYVCLGYDTSYSHVLDLQNQN